MPIKAWSTTASSNATADSASGINYAEGQAPSSLNDSNRAEMAEIAKFLKDNDGTLTTAGTATVYTVTNNGSFATLEDGLDLSITIDKNCGKSPTLNVNGLGAKKLRKFASWGECDLYPGDLVANGHYELEYDTAANGGAGAWIVLNPSMQNGLGRYDLAGLSSTDIALPSGVKLVRFTLPYVPSAVANVNFHVSRDGGSSFITASGSYAYATLTHNGTTPSSTGNTASTAAQIGTASSLTVTSHCTVGDIFIGDATTNPRYHARCVFYDGTSGTRNMLIGGHVTTTGAVNALRFSISSGTFTSALLTVEAA